MYFSAECKKELCRLKAEKDCCRLAELSALYTTLGSLNLLGRGRFSIQFGGENMAVCRRVLLLVKQIFAITPQLHYADHARFGGRRSCVITIGPMDSPAVLAALGMGEVKEDGVSLSSPAPRLPITRVCCMKAYLRGLFLGGGTLSSPEGDCHMELPCHEESVRQTAARCVQRLNLPIHYSTRHERPYMYWKKAEQVVELLRQLGAPQCAGQLEESHIRRQVFTRVSRSINCDQANVKKTVTAGEQQLALIRRLEEAGRLPSLPPALREMAEMRLAAPEANLNELAAMFHPPLSKSGANNRLRRLAALAKEEFDP